MSAHHELPAECVVDAVGDAADREIYDAGVVRSRRRRDTSIRPPPAAAIVAPMSTVSLTLSLPVRGSVTGGGIGAACEIVVVGGNV